MMDTKDLRTLEDTFAVLTHRGWVMPMWLHNLQVEAGMIPELPGYYVCQFPPVTGWPRRDTGPISDPWGLSKLG
jgi:hypothetical protein